MIGSVSLRPRKAGDGFEADLRLDPVILRGALEQQGYPQTFEAATEMEQRRLAALGQCVQRVNERLPGSERIRAFSVVGTVPESVSQMPA
jgi:hypothetical protein